MDNVCHSLAGAALAEAGLKHQTRFGTAALVIAANVPDVDVLAFLTDTPAVALRRGLTHGLVAQVLLPVGLTAMFLAIDRWRPARSGRRVEPGSMFLLTLAGVLSHVALDWLNTYGIRLLMPFSGRWFYGDAVFIVDPWLWLALGTGTILARRRRSGKPAQLALAAATLYILSMIASALAARERVVEAWVSAAGRRPAALMVGPVPLNPLAKSIILDDGERYRRGRFNWLDGEVRFDGPVVSRTDGHPAVELAMRDPDFRAVLVWSRFPAYEVERVPGGTLVRLRDVRFGGRLGSVSTVVPHD